ncbi:MAG: ribonuclease P protein component 4 [Candidatus Thorarchaeota archaeon]|nr:MAG: ribonuclease P protein component 4 [Candidatus Thorarchaeota archaeon]
MIQPVRGMVLTRKRSTRAKARRLTQARVNILWEQALEEVKEGRSDVARRHMLSARKIAQKTRTKLPRHISRRICKACGTILVPGENCRVRIRHNRSRHMSVTCLSCGEMKRYYIKNKTTSIG